MWEFTVRCTSSRVVYAGLGTASFFWRWIRKSGTTWRLSCHDPKKLADHQSRHQGCKQPWYEQRDEVSHSMSVLWWLDWLENQELHFFFSWGSALSVWGVGVHDWSKDLVRDTKSAELTKDTHAMCLLPWWTNKMPYARLKLATLQVKVKIEIKT